MFSQYICSTALVYCPVGMAQLMTTGNIQGPKVATLNARFQ